jgi:hypothetical protein
MIPFLFSLTNSYSGKNKKIKKNLVPFCNAVERTVILIIVYGNSLQEVKRKIMKAKQMNVKGIAKLQTTL